MTDRQTRHTHTYNNGIYNTSIASLGKKIQHMSQCDKHKEKKQSHRQNYKHICHTIMEYVTVANTNRTWRLNEDNWIYGSTIC